MAVREAGSRWHRGDADGTDRQLRVLRARWRTASLAAGWRFPNDWGVPEVDEVCASVVTEAEVVSALAELGRARARSGAGLEETLTDLAALHAVVANPADVGGLIAPDPDATPSRLLRAVAVAWADATLGDLRGVEAGESLTGLATEEYLRVRLGELYRLGRRKGFHPADRYVLLVVTLDLTEVVGWPRLMAMILVGDVLRSVFDGGETLAVIGPSVAVVLAERDAALPKRTFEARTQIADRLAVDPDLRSARRAEIRAERLPCAEEAAQTLVHTVRRA
ncbi:hypothetical protein SAMN05192558_11116 [Actinokineospora alba]|uniref:GGDEF domain-containing protein, diguanylate cyclase (C-di-GMP synthetase) or its enzymatically inactive variants n=1 Tax=Actinokineospora alba TaxID=504798 RepID=A0A1H0U8E3_9PSEU|nr:GGDEF domain-containing protein [Actinokineospora alba]TDP65263.1 hypothetical protein C8E96_0743 [Actinokineospora alba]SDH58297.1 hypothetical protein SAMN05421871_101565 [Actinokineospora alba]SDP62537.1 hypothetical protein SAMN05192558_11116 [Actinokineospora alba]